MAWGAAWIVACAGATWASGQPGTPQVAPPSAPGTSVIPPRPTDDASEALSGVPAYLPDIAAPFLDFTKAWPVRAFRTPEDAVQGVIVPWDVPVSRLMPDFTFDPSRPPTELDLADHAALDAARGSPLLLEGVHGLTFRLASAQEAKQKGFGRGPGRAAGPDASLVFKYVSGSWTARGDHNSPLLLQRTWFAYYEPLEPRVSRAESARRKSAGEAKAPVKATGVVLLMPGLYGTPEPVFDALIKQLREAGWGVLRMISQPSRFTQRVRMELDPANMEESAVRAAHELGDRAAECALAVQGAWTYLEEKKPELAALPKAIMGTSGGGMTLPTVVAREPERYTACVLIGAAADLWLIARRSAYTNDASSLDVRIKGVEGPAKESTPGLDWKRFDELYLSHAPLDSFHCAKAMQGKHVLVLQGQTDRAVPAELGDVLWERMGRPERWEYPTGHEGLIIEMVPRDTGKIIDWLRANGLP